jgi:hypothetical protein
MDAPPFRLARSPSGQPDLRHLHPLHEHCCEPATTKQPAAPRRTRLAELDMHIHCSVIGTCLSTSELRKLVPRFKDLDRERATDLQIHHAAVELAVEGGEGAKALHKALDSRYAVAIKRFSAVKDVDGLRGLWADALKAGDVPPAYWAVMTHPSTTLEMRQLAFGEVHMLSHLVGAANRADIRRLVALEEDNAALRNKVERQQSRLHEIVTRRDASIRALEEQLSAMASRQSPAPDSDADEQISQLRHALGERDERVALHASRCEAAERRLREEQDRSQALRERLDDALATLTILRDEASAMEDAVLQSVEDALADQSPLGQLEGKRIVYVGGRPGSHAVLRQLVESAGGRLAVHDGGVEDRKGMLSALVPGADMVVFPVDCIDHDSMNTLKRLCDRHQVAYYPVRTASVASFLALMAREQAGDAERSSCQKRVSAFCLRHG